MFKKLLSSAIVIAMVSCFAIPSFAMYGSVIANSAMDDDGTLSTHVIYGAGSAEEVIADRDDVMNIYAKTAITDPDDYILAQDEDTDHYVRQVYNSCSATLNRDELQLGIYSVSTFAATRYTDNTTNNDLDTTGYAILIQVRSNEEDMDNVDDGYIHLSLADLSNDATAKSSFSTIPKNTILDVYGQHFSQAGVGDKLPQMYVKTDGSSLYVVDENRINGTTVTYYNIENGVATQVK